jgi:hypothetical protein
MPTPAAQPEAGLDGINASDAHQMHDVVINALPADGQRRLVSIWNMEATPRERVES